MPIAFTTLGTPLASTTNATSYATASQSPTASRLLLAAVLLSRGSSTDPVTPTLSGNGLTWALVNDGVTSGNQPFPASGTLRYRLCLFQALTGGSPSAGALTVDCGGITHTGCAVIVGESNGEVDLADAVVQVDTVLHAFGAGPAAAALAAFADANNAAFSCWALDITAAITHEGTELGDVTYSTPAARLQAQYLATQDTTPGVNWTGDANAAGIAVEVRIAAAGGTTYEKTGATVADTTAAAADVHEAIETGALVVGTRAAGTDVYEATEAGTIVADTLAAGTNVFEAVETGAAVAGSLLAGLSETGGGTTFTKAGAVTATSLGFGSDVLEAVEAGTIAAGAAVAAPDIHEAVEAGTASSAATLAGPDIFEAVEFGSVLTRALMAGVRVGPSVPEIPGTATVVDTSGYAGTVEDTDGFAATVTDVDAYSATVA